MQYGTFVSDPVRECRGLIKLDGGFDGRQRTIFGIDKLAESICSNFYRRCLNGMHILFSDYGILNVLLFLCHFQIH